MENKIKIDKKYIYSDLSYKIIGVLFEVYNALGHGHPEKTYQKAVAVALQNENVRFVEQLYVPVFFGDKVVGKNYFDFLVQDKIVIEIKKGDYFSKIHIEQVYKYLVSKKLKLGILAYFALRTVHIKRVVNLR
ncbi:MAG: hypothetical protein COT92_03650 [Candidatus Doudnabacteria bacterium CG10_big_fil_rev_8_21_14_0_10_42_18]|uniref:GxxExxY protein n=1 Tax=Candidatus Doudnabacteria bacterium CG10_big_fil_rev_8_21_14_0_10_42_18 TaxID=1974552 RepID=A0A2H0VCD0_9BACT|nr:MAG: hypothetical protein COT92_03650 [Candidatus Doudnabacteria bacterium CG10_big_fil_rev_8_21_14_0_10_42_18]